MKKWLCKGTLVATATALALLETSRAQAGTCSNRSLRGNYGFTITGQLGQAPNLIPLEGVALTHFDGKGYLSQVDFTVFNGVPSVLASPRPDGFGEDETGTYTVNADCTGTATIHFPDGLELDLKLMVVKVGAKCTPSSPPRGCRMARRRFLPPRGARACAWAMAMMTTTATTRDARLLNACPARPAGDVLMVSSQ